MLIMFPVIVLLLQSPEYRRFPLVDIVKMDSTSYLRFIPQLSKADKAA